MNADRPSLRTATAGARSAASVDAAESTAPAFTFDQHVLTGLLVVIAALPFLLGDQQSSLTSVEQVGVNALEGDALKQVVLAGLYAGSVVLLLKRTRIAQSLAALGAPLLLLLALCLASASWAELPSVVFRRTVALLGTCAVGLYAGMLLDEREMLRVLVRSTWIVLLASFAVAALWPDAGLDPEGRLRGVTAHKNGLGAIAGLGLLAAACLDAARPASRLRQLPFVALCAASLALSDSASPLPVLGFAVAVLLVTRVVPPRSVLPSLLIVAAMAVAILVPIVASDLGSLSAVFGRGSDFSGRGLVWLFSLEMLQRHLAFGWGLGGFWNGEVGMIFVRWAHFPVLHAHNGFLQLALDTGLAGLLLLVAAILSFATKAAVLLKTDPRYGYGFAFACMAFFLGGNVTETLLAPNHPLTMLFVFVMVRTNLRYKARPAAVGHEASPLAARRAG